MRMVPGFRDHAGRLQQHRVEPERGIDLHGEFRLDAPALGAEAVQPLDAVLGVLPVAAHVPLAGRAGRAGDRIGMAHDADDVIAALADRNPSALRRTRPSDSWPRISRSWPCGRLAVLARDDLAIGAADAERDRLDQQRAVLRRRLGHIAQFNGIRVWRMDRDRAQGIALGSQPPKGRLPDRREVPLSLVRVICPKTGSHFRDHAAHACPSTRSSRCTISARPSMPRISSTSADDLPRIFSASSAS